ncbi:urokinase plasminogen activator surface receptor [Megalobrama amblycephala]|uniref:urokinase plasminogen activator surface receptor n=1 Tax=Megalobrama amblycephala TaxID=75352 RepID=UPI0020142332|nr:urokinase plasminogen activator surface receptor [Megalobrama amblycephala]
MTTNIYSYGRKIDSNSTRTCADPYLCVNGSMNSGQSKVTFNSQCCNAELCNIQNAPDLPQQPLNGKQCFTCNATDCSKTLACEGDETQCFITTVDIDGKKVTRKGCTSKLFCGTNATQSLGLQAGFGVYMKCCEGNLCNAAQSLRVYFVMLVLLVPLLSLFVF